MIALSDDKEYALLSYEIYLFSVDLYYIRTLSFPSPGL